MFDSVVGSIIGSLILAAVADAFSCRILFRLAGRIPKFGRIVEFYTTSMDSAVRCKDIPVDFYAFYFSIILLLSAFVTMGAVDMSNAFFMEETSWSWYIFFSIIQLPIAYALGLTVRAVAVVAYYRLQFRKNNLIESDHEGGSD